MTTMRDALARLTSRGVPFAPDATRVASTSVPIPVALLESQHTLDTLGEMILLPDTKEAWYSAPAPAWSIVAETAPALRPDPAAPPASEIPVPDTLPTADDTSADDTMKEDTTSDDTANDSTAPLRRFHDRLLELPRLDLPPGSEEEPEDILSLFPEQAVNTSSVEPDESEWNWESTSAEPTLDTMPTEPCPTALPVGLIAESTVEGVSSVTAPDRSPELASGFIETGTAAGIVEPSVEPSTPSGLPESAQVDGAFELQIRDHLRDMTLLAEYDRAINLMIRRLRHGCGAILVVHGPEEVCSSETLAHLACLLTSKNRGRILLVDADSTTRRISQRFGLESSAGLTQVLQETTGWLEAVETRFDPLLTILPAGPGVLPAARGTWDGPRVHTLVDQWREHHEIVLIDGGNLASDLAIRLSQTVEVSLLAVRLGETTPLLLQDEVDTFRAAGGRLHACLALHRPDGV